MPKNHEYSGAVIEPATAEISVRGERRLIFLSHANPEDNTFARWLSTQLANAGYEVWCDVTELLGGEKFWNDITEAIDQYAFRVLFASTIESNRKSGTLKELRIAADTEKELALKDFIVPLRVDQFPFASTNNIIRDRNFVRFDANWANGLKQLLKLLEREEAPKSNTAGPACVSDWLRRSLAPKRQTVISNARCYANWFRLRFPEHIYLHRCTGPSGQLAGMVADFPYPCRFHADGLIAFAPPHEVQHELGPVITVSESHQVEINAFIADGDQGLGITAFDARNIVSDLIRQAWEAELTRRGLLPYRLASGLNAWFFRIDHLEKNRTYFKALGGRRTYRQLVGNKSKRTRDGAKVPDGHWHYAVSASPQLVPLPRLVLRHHVLFTNDGYTPWLNTDRMFKARRRVCKQWWNAAWRDRLFAFCSALGTGQTHIRLPVGAQDALRMATVPMSFISPWTYFEDDRHGLDESADIELVEDPVGDDNDDGDEDTPKKI